MKEFGDSDTIFENMDALNPNEKAYRPDELPEREAELDEIHSALRPATMGSTPINLLIYGETGQGKTVAVDLKTSQLESWAEEEGIDLTAVTVQCKGLDKSYNAMTHLYKRLREVQFGPGEELPRGHQRKELLHMIFEEMSAIGGTITIVLDEIDALGDDDYLLYELPRADLDGVRISVIGITNDLTYTENLDTDVRSSLGEDEVVFSPYNSMQLQAILSRRAANGLRETGFTCEDCDSQDCPHEVEKQPENLESKVLEDDVIGLCAAFAAQDTGDAREALRLFFRAVRIADDAGNQVVTVEDVYDARAHIEEKAITSGIQTLPTQKKIALMSVIAEQTKGKEYGRTADLYDQYQSYCDVVGTNSVSKRRFRDFLNDLEHNGLLSKRPGGGRGVQNSYRVDVELEMAVENLPQTEERLGEIANQLRKNI